MEKLKDPAMYPDHLPYFSTMIIDSEGNLLFFEYTKVDQPATNHFKAFSYDMKGKYLGASSFKSENIDLSFNPDRFIFFNGMVYTIAKVQTKGAEKWQIIKMEPK